MATTFSHALTQPATIPLTERISERIRQMLDRAQSEQWTTPDCWRNRAGEDYRAGMRCHALATEWRLRRRVGRRLGIVQADTETFLRNSTPDEQAVFLECLLWTKSLFLRRIENQRRDFDRRIPLI